MGSALSEITILSETQRFKLKSSIEHAVIYGDLTVLQKAVSELSDADARSIAARVIGGCLYSHSFKVIGGELRLIKKQKLKWRKRGLEALISNFSLSLPRIKREFSSEFYERLEAL